MPIYEFKCDQCGKRTDMLCKTGSSGAQLSCPQCGAIGLTRIMSSFASPGGGGQGGCGTCTSSSCGSCSAKH